MNGILESIKQFAIKNKNNVYIVGGYIRDKFTTGNPTDIDIVYDGCIENLIYYLKSNGYKVIFIKEQLNMYKVFYEKYNVDIVKMKGDNIISDLSKRDFTIDAIALDLINNILIDPFKGILHIKCKLIKQVNKNSLSDDRIRILRGIRLNLKYGMHFSLDTEESIKNESKYIKYSTKERFLNEFMNIIECDKCGNAFEIMNKYNILSEILPYIDKLKVIGKCKYHKVNAYVHMNAVYKVYKKVMNLEIELKGIKKFKFYTKVGNHYLKDYIAIAAFTHDIGKYVCYHKSGDIISFKDHEVASSDIMDDWCKYWLFPKNAAKIIVNIVKGHMIPLMLFKSKIKNYRKNFYKFFNKYTEITPYILIVSFCDIYATDIYLEDNIEAKNYKNFIEQMFTEYSRYENIKSNRIINGTDVIKITHITGKKIKEILEKVDEKRYIGEINNKEECEQFIRKFVL